MLHGVKYECNRDVMSGSTAAFSINTVHSQAIKFENFKKMDQSRQLLRACARSFAAGEILFQ